MADSAPAFQERATSKIQSGFYTSDVSLRKAFPLQKRKIIKKTIWGILAVTCGWAIASIFVLAFLQSESLHNTGRLLDQKHVLWLAWVGLLVLLLLWRTAYQIMYFLTYFYDMDDKNVIIRKGVIAKREITLPFSKITDVYVDQDMLDVMFGLYDLHISTPTVSSGTFAHIDGLNKHGAATIRQLILERINKESD